MMFWKHTKMQRCVGKSCKAIICNKVKQLQKVEMEQYHRKRRKRKKLQQEGIFARSPLTFVCLIFFVRMSFEFIIINATERARNHVFSQHTKSTLSLFLVGKQRDVGWMDAPKVLSFQSKTYQSPLLLHPASSLAKSAQSWSVFTRAWELSNHLPGNSLKI